CTRGRALPPTAVPDTQAFLLSHFGLPIDSGIAPITGLADGINTTHGYWLRMDPVHLHLNRDQLILLDSQSFNIDPDEADQLVSTINQHFQDGGIRILAPSSKRWYAHFDTEQNLVFHPKNRIIGQPVNLHLPSGEMGTHWKSILNDIQMLLFAHPVNEARETRGEMAINSIWPWALGQLPAIHEQPWKRILSQNPLAAGLVQLSGGEHIMLPPNAGAWLNEIQNGDMLILDKSLPDGYSSGEPEWKEAITALETNWFIPLLEALKSSRLDRIHLHLPAENRVLHLEIQQSDLWKFWRHHLHLL
ncbi:MAG: hypothetical protein KGL58_09745, partial [Pseudomonadota bacterium]|nr:hypothetical protein [Pseudomonadota bacterium]